MKEIRIQTGPEEAAQRLIITACTSGASWSPEGENSAGEATREQMEGERPCLLPSSIHQSLVLIFFVQVHLEGG